MRKRTPVSLRVDNAGNQRDWLTLLRAPRLGGRLLVGLIESMGGARELLQAARARVERTGLEPGTLAALCRPDEDLIRSDLEWLAGEDHHLLTWDSDLYPALLRRIPSPPAALFVAGDVDALWLPQLAVIGSRNPTAGGLDHARAFSAELCRQGMAITSGLASGIDCAAHEAALESGGPTLAVTGTGLDVVYPASAGPVAARIPGQGALVSELPLGTPPRRAHFPARNRIISGLSLGVLVVEAGLNSGSLITARHAADQGREVFALPGSLHNPMARGCHRLIRQGARLVENCGDILQELAPLAGELATQLRARLEPEAGTGPGHSPRGAELLRDPDYVKVWGVLGFDPKTADQVVAQTGLTVQGVSSMILMMELNGLVTAHRGGRYSRKP